MPDETPLTRAMREEAGRISRSYERLRDLQRQCADSGLPGPAERIEAALAHLEETIRTLQGEE